MLSLTIGAIVFAEGAELARLAQARALERLRTERLQNDERRMAGVRAAYDAVAKLSAAASLARATRRSGDRIASELAEIAASLPPHLWLTALHQDADGTTLDGEAENYALIGDAMRRLAQANTVRNPVLVSSGMRDALRPDDVAYEIRVQERAR
jgi:hypothetical protein